VRGLPVRVKLLVKVRGSDREAVVKGLVNTGFTSEFPDIMIPVFLAERLGLWPRPHGEVMIATLETGGGTVEGYVIPQAVVVKVITEDRESREVVANVIVNPYVDEVFISDYLAEELGIQVLFPRRGIWRFSDEDRLRESV